MGNAIQRAHAQRCSLRSSGCVVAHTLWLLVQFCSYGIAGHLCMAAGDRGRVRKYLGMGRGVIVCWMLYLYEAFVAFLWSQDMGGFEHQVSSQAHVLLSGVPPRHP